MWILGTHHILLMWNKTINLMICHKENLAKNYILSETLSLIGKSYQKTLNIIGKSHQKTLNLIGKSYQKTLNLIGSYREELSENTKPYREELSENTKPYREECFENTTITLILIIRSSRMTSNFWLVGSSHKAQVHKTSTSE